MPEQKGSFAFYEAQYARFASAPAAAMRREVYGEDLGQQGWRSLAEQAAIPGLLRLGPGSLVLDIACGSGGPSLALVERTGCRLLGIDIEPAAIAFAASEAARRGLQESARFEVRDCGRPLPLADGSFDAVLCVDAIAHLEDRAAALAEWGRLLARGGRLLLTDSAVLTGAISRQQVDVKGSIGFLQIVAPGVTEQGLAAAGLTVPRVDDTTASIAEIAARWHAVRERNAESLRQQEGADWFAQRQSYLAVTADLAERRQLSRFLYLAEKP
ncbi:MAG: class I SAM-dependent methyltransferase [Dongiaceae bacterium]